MPLTYEQINTGCAKRNAAAENLFFYPFRGTAVKRQDFLQASFLGLDLSHDRFDIASAVMQGVAFQAVMRIENFGRRHKGKGIRLSGGALKSRVWSQIIADIAGEAILLPVLPDLGCVGAAVIAGWGAGIFDGIEEGSRIFSVDTQVIEPDPSRAALFAEKMKEYKRGADLMSEYYQLGDAEI